VGQIDREDRVKPEDAVMLRWSMKAKPVLRTLDGAIRQARKDLVPTAASLSAVGWSLGAASNTAIAWCENNPCPDRTSDQDLIDLFELLDNTAEAMEESASINPTPAITGFDDILVSISDSVAKILKTIQRLRQEAQRIGGPAWIPATHQGDDSAS
jgi:hypothetical protein